MKTRRLDPSTGLKDYLKGQDQRIAQKETSPLGAVVVREQISTFDPSTAVSAVHGVLPDGTFGFQQVSTPGKLSVASFGPSAVVSPHDGKAAPGVGFAPSGDGSTAATTGISSDDGSTLDISTPALTLNGRQVHLARFGEFNGSSVSQTADAGAPCGAFTTGAKNVNNDFCTPGVAGQLVFSKAGVYMVTYYVYPSAAWGNMHIWAINPNGGASYLSESRGAEYGSPQQSATFVMYLNDVSMNGAVEFGTTFNVTASFTSIVRITPIY